MSPPRPCASSWGQPWCCPLSTSPRGCWVKSPFADCLAEGRLVLGLGAGYQAYELARFGVDLEDASEITNEWIEFLSQGLGQESFEFHGKHIDLPQTWFTARPAQQPGPQIWIAGNSPGSQQRAVRGDRPLFVSGFGRDTDTLAEITCRSRADLAQCRKGRRRPEIRNAPVLFRHRQQGRGSRLRGKRPLPDPPFALPAPGPDIARRGMASGGTVRGRDVSRGYSGLEPDRGRRDGCREVGRGNRAGTSGPYRALHDHGGHAA